MSDYSGIRYLTTAESDLQARIIEALLESNSIPFMRKYSESSQHLKTIFGDGAHNLSIDIYVPALAYEYASKLIEETQGSMQSSD